MNNIHMPIQKSSFFTLPFVRFVFGYCTLAIILVWSIDILQSFKIETTISLCVCCFASSLIHYFDYQHVNNTESDIRFQNLKLHFWIAVIFLAILPLVVNKKVEAIWYNVDSQAQYSQTLSKGFLDLDEARLPNHKQPIQTVVFTQQQSTPVICDLISRKKCPYIEQFGQIVNISLSTRRILPYQHEPIIFELKTPNFHYTKQQHINFYKKQQWAVYAYFLLIYFPSLFLFFRMRKVLLAHYFTQVKSHSSLTSQHQV